MEDWTLKLTKKDSKQDSQTHVLNDMLCFRGELTLGVHKIPFLEFSPSRTRQFNLDPITVPFRNDLPRESQALPIRES
jgi:hypothetical protein